MQDQDFFDSVYFGHEPGERKSNYPAVGGYQDLTGAPVLFAQWVISTLLTLEGPPSPNILEVGCATGAGVRELRNLGATAYGCDLSPYILSQAQDDVRPYLYEADMRQLFESRLVQHAPFDAIVSKDVLEHATENVIDQILLDMAKLAPLQLHIVNTGEHPYQAYGGDMSHNLKLPLVEWQSKADGLEVWAIFRAT